MLTLNLNVRGDAGTTGRPLTEELNRNDAYCLKLPISTENPFFHAESGCCLMTGSTWRISAYQ